MVACVADGVGVVFVAVNYNTTEQSLALARRFDVLSNLNSKAMLLLVDNSVGACAGELGRALAAAGSSASYVVPGTNLGYFGGARFGLEMARSRGLSFRWLVVSNVDLQFDPVQVVTCLAALDAGHVGIVAPNIISGLTGKRLNPYMRQRPSALRMHAYKWIYRFYPSMRAYEWLSAMRGRLRLAAAGRGSKATTPSEVTIKKEALLTIYAGHGSMLAFSQEYFRRGGSLEHAPFLFGEEISVAEAARRAQLSVVWHPGIAVDHTEHASIGKLPRRHMHGFLREATAFCADRYF